MSVAESRAHSRQRRASRSAAFREAGRILRQVDVTPLILRDDPNDLDLLLELDVLVRRKELRSAVKQLLASGWELQDSGLFHPYKRALVRLTDGELLKLDLHGAVVDGGLVYFNTENMFAGASEAIDGFLTPALGAWTAHVVLHIILAKDQIPEKYRDSIESVAQNRAAIGDAVALTAPAQLKTLIASALATESVCEPRMYDPAELKNFRKQARRILLRTPQNLMREAWLKALWPLGQAFGWRPGVLIAFIGPDGSGKTSVINTLSKELQRLQIPVRTTYLGPWEWPVLPTTRLLQKLRIGPADDAFDLSSELPFAVRAFKQVSANIKRSLYYSNLIFELWARHAKSVLPHLMLRRVVLADRYAFDLLVGHYNRPVRSWRGVRWLITRLVSRPHITILLDNAPETVWERKQEYPLEVIASAQSRYRAIANEIGADLLRTDGTPEEIALKIVEKYWQRLVRLRVDRFRFWAP